MNPAATLTAFRKHKKHLLNQIVSFPDFRPGSLIGRYRKCGKPQCHCARKDSPGHGPCWSLTRTVNGKTVTKIIKPEAVETSKHQIAEYHRFQQVIHELIETNVKICDTLLEVDADEQEGPEGVEKGGSKHN